MIHLSKRLSAVAAFVSDGMRLLDVGTDHGYIPIALVQDGRIPSALAMDINEGPIKKAQENITNFGLESKISTRLSDGLVNFDGKEADSIVIAGMGGMLMRDILEFGYNNHRLDTISELILQPQSDIECVRHWLHDHGFEITKEDMVLDAGKYYMMFHAVKGMECYDHEYEYIYGRCLIESKHPVLKDYLTRHLALRIDRYNQLKNVETDGAKSYIPVLVEEIERVKAVLALLD